MLLPPNDNDNTNANTDFNTNYLFFCDMLSIAITADAAALLMCFSAYKGYFCVGEHIFIYSLLFILHIELLF